MGKANVNIANAVFSVLVATCGVIYAALTGSALKMLTGKIVDVSLAGLPIWIIGFAYIVPGVIGVIASVSKNKCVYITQMVFCILTLVVMGIIFIVGLILLIGLVGNYSTLDVKSCVDVAGQCVCSRPGSTVTLGVSCSVMWTMYRMSIGIISMVVIGWICSLVATILCGMLACETEYVHGGRINMPYGGPPQGFAYAQENLHGYGGPYEGKH